MLKEDRLWSSISQKVLRWHQGHAHDTEAAAAIARDLASVDDAQARKVAEDILRRILNDDPDCAQAMTALAILLQTTGRTSESAVLYERLLSLEPENVIAINNLAWIMSEDQGNYREALELAQRGLEIAPDYSDLVDTRGVIYYRLGQYEKAAENFRKCIEIGPSTARAGVATRFYLAKALAELGERKQAVAQLNEALQMQAQIGGMLRADVLEARDLLKRLEEGSQP